MSWSLDCCAMSDSHFPILFRLAVRNTLRNWRHSLATIVSIACGFTAVSVFDGFLREINERRDDGYQRRGMMGDVVVSHADAEAKKDEDFWAHQLDAKAQAVLTDFLSKDQRDVRRVRFLEMAGLISAGTQQAIFKGFGFDVADGVAMRGQRWAWNTLSGKPLHLHEGPAAILGSGLARLIGCESTYRGPDFLLPEGNYVAQERPFRCEHELLSFSAMTEAAQVNVVTLPLAGMFDFGYREGDLRMAYMPLEVAQRLLDTDKVTYMTIELKPDIDQERFMADIEAAAGQAGVRIDAQRWSEHTLSALDRGGMELVASFRHLFMTVIVLMCATIVANTVAKGINERMRELSTVRAIGFRRSDVTRLIAMEGAMLSVIACGVGLAVTLLIAYGITAVGFRYHAGFLSIPINLRIVLAPDMWALSTIALIALSTFTAWLCAKRVARRKIAEGLAHVA